MLTPKKTKNKNQKTKEQRMCLFGMGCWDPTHGLSCQELGTADVKSSISL